MKALIVNDCWPFGIGIVSAVLWTPSYNRTEIWKFADWFFAYLSSIYRIISANNLKTELPTFVPLLRLQLWPPLSFFPQLFVMFFFFFYKQKRNPIRFICCHFKGFRNLVSFFLLFTSSESTLKQCVSKCNSPYCTDYRICFDLLSHDILWNFLNAF